MKIFKIVGLGIAIWGMSLLWPEVNQILTPPVMMGLGLGLGIASLVYGLSQHVSQRHRNGGAGQNHPSQWPIHHSRPFSLRHVS